MREMFRLLFVCTATAAAALAGEPIPTVDTKPGSLIGSFEDRSAPSVYQYDASPYVGWFGPPLEFVGVNAFTAVGGSDLLSSISCVWRTVANGSAQRVFVWQDDGSGDIGNARLVAEQSVTVANTDTATVNVYSLTHPVPVSGRFYIGFSSLYTGLGSVLSYQIVTGPSYVTGRSYLGLATPPFDAASFGGMPQPLADVSTISTTGYFAIRANGSGSSFTYQGRLMSSGTNYSGPADFRFTICDSKTEGVAVSPIFEQRNVAVVGGVFTLQIPSDPSVFVNAPDRFLQVEVRTPAGSGDFTPLSPRDRIGQVPAAMVATLAQSVPWSGVSGVPTNITAWNSVPGGIGYSGGLVGIGTATPGAALQVSGGPWYRNLDVDSSFQEGTWFNLTNNGTNGRRWSLISTGTSNSEGAGALLIRDNNAVAVRAAFLPNGNIGFGTAAPTRRVQVRGDGFGFSHLSSDGGSELATFIDPNAGWIGMPGSKGLQLFTNNVARLLVAPDGKVGIGTSTPTEVLDVRGNIRLGNAGEYQAIGANAENLSIIRGVVNALGTIRWGAGFTVTRSGIGLYRINWTASPGFSDPPAATATAYLAGSPIIVYSIGAQANGDGSGFVDFRTVNLSGVLVDSAFSFTLVGPR